MAGPSTRLVFALPFVVGLTVALFVRPSSGAPAPAAAVDDAARTVYLSDCATCHGADGAGTDRGPSILESGRAGVDFYLTTGRMPLTTPEEAVERHKPKYDPETITALIEYIARLPGAHGPDIPTVDLEHADAAHGGDLYRLNCAACHAWSGRGGALLHRESPPLNKSTPTQIVEAMLVGPGNMPSFGPAAISDADRADVAAYVRKNTGDPDDPGGFPLWHLGPLPEGALAVFAGLVLLLVLARAIGTRALTRAERFAILAFFACAASSIALVVLYFQYPNTQWEGVLLGVALLTFGVALVIIAHGMLPAGPSIEARVPFGADEAESDEVEESFDRIEAVSRRRFLLLSAGSALAALAAVAVVPLRSLGPRPGNALAVTPWRAGLKLVNDAAQPVRASDVALGGLVTVFPEGAVGSADGQVVLMRVEPDLLRLPKGGNEFAPEGLVAYSKVCTHAGCPVGLYDQERHELLCPCHQSAFDVLRGAKPTSGPAARALPQLPIAIDPDGTLVATSDFIGSVGPGYWEMPR